MFQFLSGELKGATDKPDSPILNANETSGAASGDSCALIGELYGLGAEVCWGHVKLRCDKQGWVRQGECGHVQVDS